MKRNWIIIIIAIIVVVGGAYALFHKSPDKTSSSTGSSSQNASAVNNAVLVTKTDSSLGQYLADPASGKALYTYNADTSGVSNCTGSCLANWPAYVDKGSTSNLPTGVGFIKRSDNGQTQYTYQGLPLYFFTSDSKGKVTGNGVENFKVAKPAASSSSSTPSSGSSTPAQSDNSSPSYNY